MSEPAKDFDLEHWKEVCYGHEVELECLRAENARLREALSFYVRIRAQPVGLVRDFGNTAEAALEWKP